MDTTTKSTDFRLTPWPGVALPEPAAWHFTVEAFNDPWLTIRDGGAEFTLPERAYSFDLMDADPQNAESVIRLADRLGGDLVPVMRERWRDVLSPQRGRITVDPFLSYVDAVSNWAEALGYPSVEHDPRMLEAPGEDTAFVHISEISYRVWVLQEVVRAITDDIIVTSDPYGHGGFPQRRSTAWGPALFGSLSLMLRPFAPRVDYSFIDPVTEASLQTFKERPGWPPTALEVVALQLVNDVARGMNYRKCPRCGKSFGAQRDRAKYAPDVTHRRKDAKYCSKRCADGAAAAARRERLRAEKQTGSNGAPSIPAPIQVEGDSPRST